MILLRSERIVKVNDIHKCQDLVYSYNNSAVSVTRVNLKLTKEFKDRLSKMVYPFSCILMGRVIHLLLKSTMDMVK